MIPNFARGLRIRNLQMYFRERKAGYFDSNFNVIHSCMWNRKFVSIGEGYGMTRYRRHYTTWNNIKNIFMAINYLLIYTLGFLYISNSASANTQLPVCFCPWTFSLKIGLNMFPLDSFMSCLHSLLGYSTGEFQASQLIVLAVFGAVD